MAGRNRFRGRARRASTRRLVALVLASVLLGSTPGAAGLPGADALPDAIAPAGTVSAATGTQLLLDDGADYTASATVQARLLAAGATPTELRLSNSGSTVDGVLVHGQTRPWSAVTTWSLDAAPCPCGDGLRTVWAQWRAGTGPWSEPVSDTILLDRTGPTGSVVIDGGAATFGDPWAWKGSAYTFPSVRLTISVTDAGPAIQPRAWAVSRDGSTWEQRQLTSYGTFEHEYELITMNVDEGVKTVWVKFQDGLGNWSAPVTDTITLRYEQVGRVIVGDGSGYSGSFVVPVRFAIDVPPPEGIASVWLSSDYLGCSPQPYDAECAAKAYPWSEGMTISWDMRTTAYNGSTKEGYRRVIAWFVSNTGRVSQAAQAGFIIDREEPVTGAPRPMIPTNSIVSDTSTSSRVLTTIKWTSGGTGSPIATSQLQQRTNDGSWTAVSLTTRTATSASRSLSQAATYRFRSRTEDLAGNWSTWATGAEFRVRAIQQTSTSIRYGGTWYTKERPDASGGSLRLARAQGARASLTFTGRGIAVVAPRWLGGGEIDVYVDGTRIKTAYLYAQAYQARRVVFSKSWASSGTHTITIVKKYANPDYAIALDAFLVLK